MAPPRALLRFLTVRSKKRVVDIGTIAKPPVLQTDIGGVETTGTPKKIPILGVSTRFRIAGRPVLLNPYIFSAQVSTFPVGTSRGSVVEVRDNATDIPLGLAFVEPDNDLIARLFCRAHDASVTLATVAEIDTVSRAHPANDDGCPHSASVATVTAALDPPPTPRPPLATLSDTPLALWEHSLDAALIRRLRCGFVKRVPMQLNRAESHIEHRAPHMGNTRRSENGLLDILNGLDSGSVALGDGDDGLGATRGTWPPSSHSALHAAPSAVHAAPSVAPHSPSGSAAGIDLSGRGAFRLFHSDGDGIPGLFVDVYRHTAVMTTVSSGALRLRGVVARWIVKRLPSVRRVLLRLPESCHLLYRARGGLDSLKVPSGDPQQHLHGKSDQHHSVGGEVHVNGDQIHSSSGGVHSGRRDALSKAPVRGKYDGGVTFDGTDEGTWNEFLHDHSDAQHSTSRGGDGDADGTHDGDADGRHSMDGGRASFALHSTMDAGNTESESDTELQSVGTDGFAISLPDGPVAVGSVGDLAASDVGDPAAAQRGASGSYVSLDATRHVSFEEQGYPTMTGCLTFSADVYFGLRSGFALDHRASRLAIAATAASRGTKRVVDLFSYTGGLGLAAAAGGAESVVMVDTSAAALAIAAHHFLLNASCFPSKVTHTTVRTTVQAYLRDTQPDASPAGADMFIVDPPPLARSAADVPAAISMYRALLSPIMRNVAKGGVVVVFGGTPLIAERELAAACGAAAASAGRCARVLQSLSAPVDFARHASHPQSKHYSGVIVEVD